MIWRIKSRRVFSELRTRGIRVHSGPIRMSYVSVATCEPQLAFAIGRRFGSAVERNRARRRLRAAFISAWRSSPTPAPGAYLVTADRSVLTSGFDRLVTALQRCLDQAAVRSSIATSGEAT